MPFCTSFEYYNSVNQPHEICKKKTDSENRDNKCRCMIHISSWGDEKATKGSNGSRYRNVSCYVKRKPLEVKWNYISEFDNINDKSKLIVTFYTGEGYTEPSA